MKKHVNTKHVVKKCNKCDLVTKSFREMKIHKNTEHEPDDFVEESAFQKTLYSKTWKERGIKDQSSALQAYKPKIQNIILTRKEPINGIL